MSRASRVPLLPGLLAVLVALGGLGALFYGFGVGVRNARVEPYLFNTTSGETFVAALAAGTFAALLLVSAGLLLAGRPGGRSALVWLCGTGVTLALLLSWEYYLTGRPAGYDIWIGAPAWVGVSATLIMVLALAAAAILLGLPAARHAVERPAGPVPERVPGPLRRCVWLLSAGAVLSVGSFTTSLELDSYADDQPGALLVFGLFAMLMVIGGIVATIAAGYARGGRIAAAHLARGGGAVLLVGQWLAVGLTAEATVISLGRFYDAEGVPAPLGITLYCLCSLGVVASIGGLAGLADPRAERFIRAAEERRNSQWASWATGPDPIPMAGAMPASVPVFAPVASPIPDAGPAGRDDSGGWSAP